MTIHTIATAMWSKMFGLTFGLAIPVLILWACYLLGLTT
jgi:hypothetical protein